jgi:hypothetical protein
MPLPWMHFRPASITSHLDESIMIGTRAISGSPAIRFRKRTIAARLSSMASSMLMSMTWAPFSTCWRATARAFSYSPARIILANTRLPVTLVRSPTLTNSEPVADQTPVPVRTGASAAARRKLDAAGVSEEVMAVMGGSGNRCPGHQRFNQPGLTFTQGSPRDLREAG